MRGRIAAVVSAAVFLLALAAVVPADEPTIHPQHPRMLFRKEDLSWMRERCATTHGYWYRRMKSWLDAQAEVGGGAGVEHAMLYQLTGDERYARAALEATEMDPQPGVYDLLYEAMDPKDRERYGLRILPGEMSKWHTGAMGAYFFTAANMGKCLALCGDGVGDDDAQRRAGLILKQAPITFDYHAEPAPVPGGWMCSFHCGCFVRNLLEYYDHWLVATGENRFTDSYLWPAHATWMAQHLIPGRWTLVPLSSAWWGEGKTLDRAALPEVAHRCQDPTTQFFLNQYRRFVQWEYAPGDRGYGYFDVLDPKGTGLGYWHSGLHNVYRMILHYDPAMAERPLASLPLTAFYRTWGRACMRSSWEDDAVFSVFKCGWFRGGEPPDLDDANFSIYHKGNLVLENSWNFQKVSVLSVNQNTITVLDPDEEIRMSPGGRDIERAVAAAVNDGGQSFYDPKQTGPYDRGKVVAFEDRPEYLYVAGDATKSYHPKKMRQFVRQYVYVKPDVFVICDRVVSTKAEFEKRFVLRTRTQPELEGNVLRADASELLLPEPVLKPIFPYKYGNFIRDTVPGFRQPEYENYDTDWQTVWHKDDEAFGKVVASKVPNRKVTLRFESRFGGEEIAVVHNTGPQYGEVHWSLDGGAKGTFTQHAAAPAYQQKTTIVRDLMKGEHTLTLVAPAGLMNVEVFEVKLGGRMFVKTLLPQGAKINVVEGYPESGAWHSRDRYGNRRRWRLEVRPAAPATDDVFLHVIQVGELTTDAMMPVTLVEEGERAGAAFELNGRRCRLLFNRTGAVGGHVSVTGGGQQIDRDLTDRVNDLRDEVLEASCAKARSTRYYDYETSELAGLGPDADAAALRRSLSDPKWPVRYHACRMLGMRREKAAEADLVKALSDADGRVAAAAAEALGRLKTPAAVTPLVRKLASSDATVRFSAAWALGRIGSNAPQVLPALTARLADADPFVVYAAADALGRLDGKTDATTVAALVKVAGTKDHVARAKAAEVLGTLKTAAAVPVLKTLAAEGDDGERISALRALGRIATPEAAAFLTTYVAAKQGEAVDRLAAARALAEGTGGTVALRALMSEPSARVRQAAVFELARRGDKAGLDLLVKDLESADAGTRQGAFWALYRLGDRRGLRALAEDLQSTDWGTRTSAQKRMDYVVTVLGDKRAAVKAMIDTVARFVDETEKGDDPGGNWVYERLYVIGGMLKSAAGQDFWNWGRYRASKEAREEFRKRMLDWWTEHGEELPEVAFKGTP